MNDKYYKVLAKCGHVGRNKYILKWFYVKAQTGEEAAKIVRDRPRVKHGHKDAIKDVKEILLKEYLIGIKQSSNDMYFRCSSKQEQRMYNCVKLEEIYPKVDEPKKYKKNRNGQRIKYESMVEEKKKEIEEELKYYGQEKDW